MRDSTEADRREAREGVRFARTAEADPIWHNISIRMRLRTPAPGVCVESRGDQAGKRIYLFCASILGGAGLLSHAEVKRIKASIEAVYGSLSPEEAPRG